MHENEISNIVIEKSIMIHREFGPGLFESVYEEILFFELLSEGLNVVRQLPIPVI